MVRHDILYVQLIVSIGQWGVVIVNITEALNLISVTVRLSEIFSFFHHSLKQIISQVFCN
jgi:hypothetical protein